MRTAAILPVKRFAGAKQRLGTSIADPLRLELARSMVADVLAVLAEADSIDLTIVVTSEPSVAEQARGQRAIVIDDSAQQGQSAAVILGVRRALAEGIERVLCIPGDCPTLDPADLEALLIVRAGMEGSQHEVVVIPDRHGSGTNGLLLTPPDAISPSFGPDSCERHLALALAAGATRRIERPLSLLLDIDTGDDLTALRARLSVERSRASRTRAVLDSPQTRWPAFSPAA